MSGIPYEPADIVIYIPDKGVVQKEKSLVAYDTVTNKILAFGTEAASMAGRETENIKVVSPLRRGMIADYAISVNLFTYLLQKVWGKKPFSKPSVAICLPEGATHVEKRAVQDVLYQSGAKEIMFAETTAEELMALPRTAEKLAREYPKFKIMIGITKDDPEGYITEELGQILQYAKQNRISAERVMELLRKLPCGE